MDLATLPVGAHRLGAPTAALASRSKLPAYPGRSSRPSRVSWRGLLVDDDGTLRTHMKIPGRQETEHSCA
jgi:hypothetical protein